MITQIDSHVAWSNSARSSAKAHESTDVLPAPLSFFAAVPIVIVLFLLLSTRPSTILVSSAICLAVIAVWMVCRMVQTFRGIPPERESIMNFSHMGTLICICAESVPKERARFERRQSCRTCGHVIEQKDLRRLEIALTRMEIAGIAAKLRSAAIESQGMELPSSIETIDELAEYLKDAPPPPPGGPPRLVSDRRFA